MSHAGNITNSSFYSGSYICGGIKKSITKKIANCAGDDVADAYMRSQAVSDTRRIPV